MDIVTYKLKQFSEINLNDPFFDSLKKSYPEFIDWWNKKCANDIRARMVCYNKDKIVGFLHLKIENFSEYQENCNFTNTNNCIKISTFKIQSTNKRLGERFLKEIFDYAFEKNIKNLYVTIFENAETNGLIKLLKDYGFKQYDKIKDNGELVFIKEISYNINNSIKQNYPICFFPNKQQRYFWLPIYDSFHNKLFGIDANSKRLDHGRYEDIASTYSIEKIYISKVSKEKILEIKPGDILVIYRIGKDGTTKGYTSIVSWYCILQKWDELKCNTYEEFLKNVSNRTAFSEKELKRMFDFFRENKNKKPIIVSFLFVKNLSNNGRYPILNQLRNIGIIPQNEGPRPFDEIKLKTLKK